MATEEAVYEVMRVHELGGPEAMRWEEVEVGDPGDGEIRIQNTAVIDVYSCKGIYAGPLPFNPRYLQKEGRWPSSHLGAVSSLDSTRRGPGLLHVSFNKGDRRELPQPSGCRALQPLGGGHRRESRRLRRAYDLLGDLDAGGHRGGGPRHHLPAGGTVRVHRRLNSEPW